MTQCSLATQQHSIENQITVHQSKFPSMSVDEIPINQKHKIFSKFSESPIDINVINAHKINLPDLTWINYEKIPDKIQLENSGETLVLLPEWSDDTPPYLKEGPFEGNYIFSRVHFHWGQTINGSEHTIEGVRMPLEMHAIHYKREYSTLKVARKFDDGVLILVYLMELKSNHNPVLHRLISKLQYIQSAESKILIEPFAIDELIRPFTSDYYTYYGSIATSTPTLVFWLINRKVTTISPEQLRNFHQLQKPNGVTLYANSRKANPFTDQLIFHVNPQYPFINSTLSPIPIMCTKQFE